MGVFQRICRTGVVWAVVLSSLGSWFLPSIAFATTPKAYEGTLILISGSGKLTLKPGETKEVMIGLQNIGTKTWSQKGTGFVSVYTYDPKYRKSAFTDSSWYKASQPAKLSEATVRPNDVGHVKFKLKAPEKEGTYAETFQWAAENIAWIPGSKFTLNIVVAKEPPPEAVAPMDGTTSGTAVPSGLSAMVLLRSAKQVVAAGGESVSYTVGIKNTGTTTWLMRELRLPDISAAAAGNETWNSSWLTKNRLVANASGEVKPGSMDFFTFSFSAPRTAGSHTVRYVLAANETVVPDFYLDIPVEVTSNAPFVYETPVTVPADQIPVGNLIEEPMLRVGVLIVDEETSWQVVISCRSAWQLKDINGALLGELEPGQAVTAFYKNGKYWFNRGKELESNTYALRFMPNEANSVCGVDNFDRRRTRDTDYPDNTFRNILELRYNPTKNRTWLINELPMEYYLYGLGETSNISHMEYQKALVTAARTYALYHWERGTKRASEFFHVTGYADDQVYRGYGHEERSPRIVQAVVDTRGVTVTYNGNTALTPYFSRSDGRTRDWSEVWGGEVAWLKSVPTPCDVGRTLWGHGVGMSATEALCQANNGKGWQDIIKYFYQNVSLAKRWN
jgi:hypothetical protein